MEVPNKISATLFFFFSSKSLKPTNLKADVASGVIPPGFGIVLLLIPTASFSSLNIDSSGEGRFTKPK